MRAVPFLRDGIYYAIFALSLNTAGYTGEILRGAILAVPHGEIEAGKAFGMSKWKIFRRITLPRAIRICLPTMSTEAILSAEGDGVGVDWSRSMKCSAWRSTSGAAVLPNLRDSHRRAASSISCWSSS